LADDGAGALVAPPSLAAADWCSRLGAMMAKATSNAISVHFAIDLCFGLWMDGWARKPTEALVGFCVV